MSVLNDLHVGAGRDRQRRRRVPEFMRVEAPGPSFAHRPIEHTPPEVPDPQHIALRRLEHQRLSRPAVDPGLQLGREEARQQWGVEMRWIADGVRDSETSPYSVTRTVDWISELSEADGVVALGLGGNEVGHPPAPFAADFARALGGYGERVTDPAGIVRSAPGVGRIGAPQIAGRLGDASRFANLGAIRSFAGLVPDQDSSGQASRAGGPTRQATPACAKRCSLPPNTPARSIRPWRPATSARRSGSPSMSWAGWKTPGT